MMEDVHIKLNPGLPQQKQHSTRGRFFHKQIVLNLRKKLVKCYNWSTALYCSETWTLQKAEQKHLETFDMC